MLKSKKFWAFIGGCIAAALQAVGLDPAIAEKLVAMAAAYCVGQGIADAGKEAAKLKAGAP